MKNILNRYTNIFVFGILFVGGGYLKPTSTLAQQFEEFEMYDDSTYYLDGKDVIWIYGEDTGYVYPGEDTTATMEGIEPNDINAPFAFPTPLPEEGKSVIYITPGVISKNITKNIFGLNLADMFNVYNLPDQISSEEQWNWLLQMQPQVLRIPSGSPSMFSHLLPYKDADSDGDLDDILGLGYDIYEIARYFDRTDGFMEYPTTYEILNDNDIALSSWISLDFIQTFKSYRDRYNQQQYEVGSYLNQFVALINYMKSINPTYRPKVIVVLNIVSATAEQNREVIDYLLAQDIAVTGIEMGNECYDKLHCSALGMSNFDNYYNYINGTNITDYTNVFQLEDGSYVEMKNHHDFIGAFRGANNLDVKIGLVAKGHAATSIYPLRMESTTCETDDELWNKALYAKRLETVTDYSSQFVYDAVIIHSYFETNQYGDILIGDATHTGVSPNLACNDDDASADGDPWWFDSFDPRLYEPFKQLRIEIKDFAKNGFASSYEAYSDIFHFELLPSEGGKELWPTEWNIKVKRNSYNEAQQTMVSIFANDFLNGVILQEWWLRYYKLGFSKKYRPGVITNATFHSFSGGVDEFLLTLSNNEERVLLGKNISPYNLDENLHPFTARNYYVKRTNMFIAELLSQIPINSLKYLPATIGMTASLPNLAPTLFLDPVNHYIYIYYTNVTALEEDFKIDPVNLPGLLDAATVNLGIASINYIDAKMPYSTSGRSNLYRYADQDAGDPSSGIINACYALNDPNPLIEINQIKTKLNEPNCSGSYSTNCCISVPPYSAGYIKIPYSLSMRTASTINTENNFIIYPNPARDFITIFNSTLSQDESEYLISIRNAEGKTYYEEKYQMAEKIDISNLPSGNYICTINDGSKILNLKFVKL